jgi:hypothetical protein
MVCRQIFRSSAKSRACLAGLLMGGMFGLPLRADDARSASAVEGTPTPAAVEQSAPAFEQPSAFRFTDTGKQTGRWRRRPAANVLQVGNSQPRSQPAAQSDRSDVAPGFRFEGEPVPPRTIDGEEFLRPIAEPLAAPAASSFRLLGEQPSLARRRTEAGHLTLGNDGAASTAATSNPSAGSVSGFSFTDTRPAPQAAPLRRPSIGEPTPARHPLLANGPASGNEPTQFQLPIRQASAASQHPLQVGEDAAAGQDGVLITIRKRSDRKADDATAAHESTPSSAEPMPAVPGATPVAARVPVPGAPVGTATPPLNGAATTWPSTFAPASPIEHESPAGIVRVSNSEPEPQTSHQVATTAEGIVSPGRSAASSDLSTVPGSSASGSAAVLSTAGADSAADVLDWAHTPPAGTTSTTNDPFVADEAGRFDRSVSEPAPATVSHDDTWWAALETPAASQNEAAETRAAPAADESNTPAGIDWEQSAVPVVAGVGTDSPSGGSGASAARASAPEEPAWLDPSPQSVPMSLNSESAYSAAIKPPGAEALPESGDAYRMGPGRATRRLPSAAPAHATSTQPQWAAPPSSDTSSDGGEIRTSSIELAALLDDLQPLAPGAQPLPGPDELTVPTAADFPSSADPSYTSTPGDAAGAGASAEGVNVAEQTLGQRHEETNEPLQFLRRQTVLLEPGEHQFDVGVSYLNDMSDFPVLITDGVDFGVVRGQARQRLLSVPLELRVGVAPYTQAFVNVPFGWSNSEVSFNGSEFTEDEGGIGDVSAGLTRQIVIGNQYYPDVLASLAFSAPTGDSSITTALGTPGSSLGQGFWTLTGGLSFIQTYDPLVFFYGLGYTFRFQNEFGDNIEIEPGDQVFYRFGAGFAVNPHVTLSAAFTGSVIGRDKVNGIEIGGSVREPMSIRLAATISRRKGSKTHSSFKLVEPYVNFGLNEDSIDTVVGISWTH